MELLAIRYNTNHPTKTTNPIRPSIHSRFRPIRSDNTALNTNIPPTPARTPNPTTSCGISTSTPDPTTTSPTPITPATPCPTSTGTLIVPNRRSASVSSRSHKIASPHTSNQAPTPTQPTRTQSTVSHTPPGSSAACIASPTIAVATATAFTPRQSFARLRPDPAGHPEYTTPATTPPNTNTPRAQCSQAPTTTAPIHSKTITTRITRA